MMTASISVYADEAYNENISDGSTETIDKIEDIEENEDKITAEDIVEWQDDEAEGSENEFLTNEVNTLTTEEWNEIHAVQDEYEAEYASDDDNIISEASSRTTSGWISCGTMTSGRSYMASAAVDNKIYTFGGQEDGKAVQTCEMFDTAKEIWHKRTSLPQKRYKHNALAIKDKVYICGGYDENDEPVSDIDVYDIASDSWETPIKAPKNNTNYASAVYKDKLYLISGLEDGTDSGKIYVYDTENSSWSEAAELNEKYIDAKTGIQDNYLVVFTDSEMIFYDIDKAFAKGATKSLERSLVDYAVISRNYENTPLYYATNKPFNGFYLTGGRSQDSNISTAAVTAYYTGLDFTVPVAGWTYDLRLIRGLACHNMVEANEHIYIFGGQVVKGTDQKLMFKRSIYDRVDDVPGVSDLTNGAVVGSINSYGDTDSFTITPKETSIYSFRPYTYWYGLEFKLFDDNKTIGCFYDQDGVDKYVYGFQRLLYAGKTYRIDIHVPLSYNYQWGTYAFAYLPISDDAPNTLDEAGNIELDKSYTKSFEGIDDIDCFKFDITEEGKYNLSISTEARAGLEYYVYKEANIAKALYSNSVSDGSTKTETMRLQAGTYYLKFQGQDAGYSFNIIHKANIHKLLTGRSKHQLNAVDGKLYAVAGLDNQFRSIMDIEVYDPNDHSWTQAIKNLNVNSDFTSVSVGGCIYVIGGRDSITDKFSAKIQRYKINDGDFVSVGQLNTARERAGLAVKDNNIYIAGGRDDSGYLDSIEIYNTETNAVTGTLHLPQKMIDPQIFFYNDILYIVAGIDESGFSDKVYALEDDEWKQKCSMSYPGEYVRGELYKGNFYCASVNSNGNTDIIKYDIAEDQWSIIEKDFIKGIIYYDTSILNGLMYIAGGYSTTEDKVSNKLYCLDVVTDISSVDASIPIRTLGYEYEQTVKDTIMESPSISGVNAKVIDKEKGIYNLYINDENYKYDGRNTPFFFWSAREGVFKAVSDDYRNVMFYADPGTGNRKVKVVVGIGDGRGYVDKKAFLLDGNSKTE